MKRTLTNKIEETIYSYEVANKLYEKSYWGDEFNCKMIDGKIAVNEANKKGYTIAGILQEGVCYIFRFTKKGDKLVPYHMTMRPKTEANIDKFSKKYGYQSIINEIKYDI